MSIADYFAWRAPKEEPRTVSLAEQLKAAEAEVNEARRVKRIAGAVLLDWQEKMKNVQWKFDRGGFSDVERNKLPEMRSQFQEKNRLAAEAAEVLAEKRAVVDSLHAAVNQTPLNKEMLAGHREIIARATTIVPKLWALLLEVQALARQVETLASDEQRYVSSANAKLHVAGLPDFQIFLPSAAITPSKVLDLPLKADHTEALRRLAALKERFGLK